MSFYSDVIARDPRFHTISVVKDVSLLEPGTRAKVAKMIVMAHAAGHELRVGPHEQVEVHVALDACDRARAVLPDQAGDLGSCDAGVGEPERMPS